MKLVWRVSLLIILGLVCGQALAVSELRGVWVDAFHPGFRNHGEVVQMVSWAKAAHLNCLYVQVRKRGDAYYSSHVEPKAADVAAGYDPLADIISQAHARGLQVHAWLSILEVAHSTYALTSEHVAKAHPDWLMTDRDGGHVFLRGKIFLDPGVPAVQDHIVRVVTEIVTDYQVDGIHLDNLAYPGVSAGYNSISVDRFNRECDSTSLPDGPDVAWCKWRRDQITGLLGRIRAVVHGARPNAQVSAAVIGPSAQTAASLYLQDWGEWGRQRLVDCLVPMAFAKDGPSIAAILKSRQEVPVCAGIAAWTLPSRTTVEQIESARSAGVSGVVLYSYYYLANGSSSVECIRGQDLSTGVFAIQATVPTTD